MKISRSYVIVALVFLVLGFGLGMAIYFLPSVTYKNELLLSDVIVVVVGGVMMSVIGLFFHDTQRKLSDEHSKKQKLLERLHREIFLSMDSINEIIKKSVEVQSPPLDDSIKIEIGRHWKVISQNTARIDDLAECESALKNLGTSLHSSIMTDRFPTTGFKYDTSLQMTFDNCLAEMQRKLDEIVYLN